MTQHLTILYQRNHYDNQAKDEGYPPFSAAPGKLFKERTLDLYPTIQTDIRILGDDNFISPLQQDTKILALGQTILTHCFGAGKAIDKERGYRLTYQGRPAIATYSPIECWEFRADDEETDEENEKGNEKDAGRTRRSNRLFWAAQDFEKLLRPPRRFVNPTVRIRPDILRVAAAIDNLAPGSVIITDIETRRHDNCLDCLGLGIFPFADKPNDLLVAVIPIYDWNNKLAYSQQYIAILWRALYKAFLRRDITIVGHNLSFDLSNLHHYYHLPIPYKLHDTMLFMHRHWPLADKSLHHAIALYTDAAVSHKDNLVPNISLINEMKVLEYNGQDIVWTAEVYRGQLEVMRTATPEFRAAIQDANAIQRTTLFMTFTGMRVDERAHAARQTQLQTKLNTLERLVLALTDKELINPNAAQQCARYFYVNLNYPIIALTETGAPAMSEKIIYELQLKQDNPLFALIIAYRETKKELSMLNFHSYVRHTTALV